MRHYKKSILTAVAQQAHETIQSLEADNFGKQAVVSFSYSHSADHIAAQSNTDRADSEIFQDTNLKALAASVGTVSQPFRRQKRARASTEAGSTSHSLERGSKNARVHTLPNAEEKPKKLIQFEISDTEELRKWTVEAFEAVQQVTCRLIAKLWIKKIEPKKQSAHPYNGGLPKDEEKNPERTKPSYWPPGIPHKEPDHIQKSRELPQRSDTRAGS